MPPTCYYECICNKRTFTSQRALTLHENACYTVAARDQARYTPYTRRDRPVESKDSHGGRSMIRQKTGNYMREGRWSNANIVRQFPPMFTFYVHVIMRQSSTAQPDVEMAPPSSMDLPTTSRPLDPIPVVSTIQPSYPSTRSRTRCLLQTYREDFDALPEPPAPLDPPSHKDDISTSSHPAVNVQASRRYTRFVRFETPVDSFGRYRVYVSKPLTIPDSGCELADFSDGHTTSKITNSLPHTSLHDAISPCPNLSTFYFLHWFWKGSNKSIASREELRSDVLLRPDFDRYDLANVNLQAIDKKLSAAALPQPDSNSSEIYYNKSDGWVEKSVSIQVPMTGKRKATHATFGQAVSVPGTLVFKFIPLLYNTYLY